jgi:hypothetical protein
MPQKRTIRTGHHRAPKTKPASIDPRVSLDPRRPSQNEWAAQRRVVIPEPEEALYADALTEAFEEQRLDRIEHRAKQVGIILRFPFTVVWFMLKLIVNIIRVLLEQSGAILSLVFSLFSIYIVGLLFYLTYAVITKDMLP